MNNDLWPKSMTFKAFCQAISYNKDDFYKELYQGHPFQIKNQTIAIKRLKAICEATFSLANEFGFQAMTLRQLSSKTKMSMGGLYAYIDSKEDLASLIYSSLNHYCQKQIEKMVSSSLNAREQLSIVLRCHLYLSEQLQPWFYFAFMEARTLKEHKQTAIETEQVMQDKLESLLKLGKKDGSLINTNNTKYSIALKAALIKSMLQDWYLKRGKYLHSKITVDQYADELLELSLSTFTDKERI